MADNLKRLRAELEQLGNQHKAWKKQVPTLQDLIRRAYAAGIIQAEIVELTGYQRDNIRLLCMDPAEREELRSRRRKGTPPVTFTVDEPEVADVEPAPARGGRKRKAG